MSKLKTLQALIVLSSMLLATSIYARDYIIYSIAHEIPMGHKDEVAKKNFYINIGDKQGEEKGTVLDVYRMISRLDPYQSKQRYNYNVKIGELEVLHSENDMAIAHSRQVLTGERDPLFEIKNFMIGDKVQVHVQE